MMWMNVFLRLVMSFGAIALGGNPLEALAGDSPSEEDGKAPVLRLSLHAAAEPRPALRYRLLPSILDLRPGNAAVFYNKAALMLGRKPEADKDAMRASAWLNLPLDGFPQAEAATVMDRWESVFKEVDYAVRREQCDWQMPVREGVPYAIVLPELQELRNFARMLAVKARLAIVQGKYEQAVAALRTGYALARHAATGPTLIHALVGIAIANIMTGQARDLAQQPGAPNLYWAFSSLPQPFISLELAYEYEADSLYFWHPEWRDLDRGVRSAAEWRRRYDELVDALIEMDTGMSAEVHRFRVVGLAIRHYAEAKRWLVERGRSAEAVELMTVPQVVVLYSLGTYDDLRDSIFKWARLPYSQVRGALSSADQSVGEKARSREIVPLAQTLLPAIAAATQAQVRADRAFALARAIEALRLYAAEHDGKLPKQLNEIKEAPVPDDPWLGGPFDYRLSGETASLEAPAPAGFPAEYFGVRYEITIAQ